MSLDCGSHREMDPSHRQRSDRRPWTGLDRARGAGPWKRRRGFPQLNLVAIYSAGVGRGADAEGNVLSVNGAFNGAADSATSRSETTGRRFQLSGQRTTVLHQACKAYRPKLLTAADRGPEDPSNRSRPPQSCNPRTGGHLALPFGHLRPQLNALGGDCGRGCSKSRRGDFYLGCLRHACSPARCPCKARRTRGA